MKLNEVERSPFSQAEDALKKVEALHDSSSCLACRRLHWLVVVGVVECTCAKRGDCELCGN